jgi:hypothetical protein
MAIIITILVRTPIPPSLSVEKGTVSAIAPLSVLYRRAHISSIWGATHPQSTLFLSALIHPSAWKEYSANFALTAFKEVPSGASTPGQW